VKQWLNEFSTDRYFDGWRPECFWLWLSNVTTEIPDMSDCTPLEMDDDGNILF
jgi:hypothetical protein